MSKVIGKRYVDRQMGMQPIIPVTVPVKKIKGAARQRNVVTLSVDELYRLFKPYS